MDPSIINELRRSVRGRIVTPDDDDFDDVRQTFNATVARRPPVIVQTEDTDDVVITVRVANAAGLPVAIRGGGHSVAGHAIAEDAINVDLRRMRGVTVDPATRLAVVQGGAIWEDVDRATIPHDLATTGGTFWDTGVGGLTLSGGLGYLMGTAGLTCDNLRRATVVTASGEVVEAGPAGDLELLWALRGGGGNFGVVTEFEFQLHPIGPWQVGRFVAHLDEAPDALEALDAYVRQMPDEIVMFVEGPASATPAPIGEDASGPFDHVVCSLVFQGTPEEARAAFAPLAAQPQWSGEIKSETYEAIQSDGVLPFGLRHYWKGYFLRDVDRPAAEAIADAMRTRPQYPSFVLFEAINGRARVEPEGGAAFGQRGARWNVSAIAIWEDPAHDDEHIAWARRTAAGIAPSSYSGAGYANYASADETAERVRAAFGEERFARLQAVKRRYDPDNMFRFNLNVPPGPPSS
jgi:FAD/FMN-containing dehydrogenase